MTDPTPTADLLASARAIASDEEALTVDCPFCQAQSGQQCVGQNVPHFIHLMRRDVARRARTKRIAQVDLVTVAAARAAGGVDAAVERIIEAGNRLDRCVATARVMLQRHADSGDVRPTADAADLAQALAALVAAVDPHPTPKRAPVAPHRPPQGIRVRHLDGAEGVIPPGQDPQYLMGEGPLWDVTWDDGTTGAAHDDELTVLS